MRLRGEIKPKSHILFSISIMQAEQSLENFTAMVDVLIANQNIIKVTILKADTLQRFRLMALKGLNEKEAEEEAKALGERWEKDNAEAISKLKNHKECEVLCWDYYRFHPKFDETSVLIMGEYDKGRFKHNVRSVSANFIKKFELEFNSSEKRVSTLQLFHKYIIEESIILVLMSHDEQAKYDYEVYYGERNYAMQYAYKKFVPDKTRMVFNPFSAAEKPQDKTCYSPDKKFNFFKQNISNPKNPNTSISYGLVKEDEQEFFIAHCKLSGNASDIIKDLSRLFEKRIVELTIRQRGFDINIFLKIKLGDFSICEEKILMLSGKYANENETPSLTFKPVIQ